MDCSQGTTKELISTGEADALEWQEWDDIYIVYQPSSAETHVFNETTALILKCLRQGTQSIESIREWAEEFLGIDAGELEMDGVEFALARLEELGFIECLEEAFTVQ